MIWKPLKHKFSDLSASGIRWQLDFKWLLGNGVAKEYCHS